jgi:hypothetical protein
MAMHGQMFDFPRTFSRANTAGIRPICTHLRYVPDFCDWNGRLVIASDDTSVMGNPLAGQSQSNLWFGDLAELKTWGPTAAWGGVWVGDAIERDVPSDPFLVAGYATRVLHLSHTADTPVTFTVEADAQGNGKWQQLKTITVPAKGYWYHAFDAGLQAEWVRLKADKACTASGYFHCGGREVPPWADATKDSDGGTALHSAAFSGHAPSIAALLKEVTEFVQRHGGIGHHRGAEAVEKCVDCGGLLAGHDESPKCF